MINDLVKKIIARGYFSTISLQSLHKYMSCLLPNLLVYIIKCNRKILLSSSQ